MQVVDLLILFENEAGDRLPDQRAAGHSQQGGGREVGLQDQSLLGQGAVAHRGQVIQIKIAGLAFLQFCLGRPQCFVLPRLACFYITERQFSDLLNRIFR